jgi:hypothetical protein
MKAVDNHCAVLAVMLRLAIRCGSATIMMVSFRIITKAETSKSPITILLRAVLSGGGAASAGCSAIAKLSPDMVLSLSRAMECHSEDERERRIATRRERNLYEAAPPTVGPCGQAAYAQFRKA